MATIVSRILLICILPVIVLIFYLEGQHFDPALLRFESNPPGTEGIMSVFPDNVSGYLRTGGVRVYTKENLYEYVNGHAEYFISAGFASLAVGEYSKDVSKGVPDIIIDVYDMAKAIQAFGILSDESGGRVTDIAKGLTGFRTPEGLSFVKGRYYIRISSYDKNSPVITIAENIAGGIPAATDGATAFERLPDIGHITATRYIKEAYRGLDFVNNVMEREYDVSGENVQVFIVTGGKQEIQNLDLSFTNYFRQSGITYSVEKYDGNTIYKIKDPYEGDWVLIREPDAMLGIYGAVSDTIISEVIKKSR